MEYEARTTVIMKNTYVYVNMYVLVHESLHREEFPPHVYHFDELLILGDVIEKHLSFREMLTLRAAHREELNQGKVGDTDLRF